VTHVPENPPVVPARLVVLQGPTHALFAAAAVAVLEAERHLATLILIGDHTSMDGEQTERITVECCAAIDITERLPTSAASSIDELRQAVAGRWDVVEILAVRNWQPVNDVSLAAFPNATRVTYGDGFGFLNADRSPDRPQFHRVLAGMPLPLAEDTLEGTVVDVIPAGTVHDVIALTRARRRRIADWDDEIGEFGKGGVLMLTAYLAEVQYATLQKEIQHLERLVAAHALSPDAPIVIKPHPRATLGQVPELARRLRARGHPVRVLTRYHLGLHPIELLSSTVTAAAVVEPGISQSALSLKVLYGTESHISERYAKDRRLFTPQVRGRFARTASHYNELLTRLDTWDGATPMPPSDIGGGASKWESVLRHLHRPFVWRVDAATRRRTVPFRQDYRPAGTAGWASAEAPDLGVLLLTPSASSLGAPDSPAGGASADVLDDMLRNSPVPPDEQLVLIAAVSPSTHAPAWETALPGVLRAPVAAGATFTAEQVEECLEAHFDVIDRQPRLHRRGRLRDRAVPGGHVVFFCRGRRRR
jgi:hypothetical protein